MKSVLGGRDAVLDEVLRHALLEKRQRPIQVDDNAGRILQMLTMIHKPKLVIEIGSLFAYSTIHIARGLPPGGRIVGLEIDLEVVGIARHSLAVAGLSDRAQIIHGDALDYIATLDDGSVDMAFIDADKKCYAAYLKAIVGKLPPGGLLVADDAFADSAFAENGNEAANNAEVRGIHAYNAAMGRASAFFSTFLTTETGLLVSVKR